MVIYTCEKCNKEYDHKGSYEKHLKRKIPCDSKAKNKIAKKRNSKSIIQKIEESNNNCDSDTEINSISTNNLDSKNSSKTNSQNNSRVNSRINSRVNSRINSRRNSFRNIDNKNDHEYDNYHDNYLYSPNKYVIETADITENMENMENMEIKKTSTKKNSKTKINNVTFETPDNSKSCEIINGDFLVMDKILDKISTLLTNSSHTTNIYVKDNATIIYNAFKNDDFNKNYLENKPVEKCSDSINKINGSSKNNNNTPISA